MKNRVRPTVTAQPFRGFQSGFAFDAVVRLEHSLRSDCIQVFLVQENDRTAQNCTTHLEDVKPGNPLTM